MPPSHLNTLTRGRFWRSKTGNRSSGPAIPASFDRTRFTWRQLIKKPRVAAVAVADARARHRRDHGDLQRGLRRGAAAAAAARPRRLMLVGEITTAYLA